MYPAPAECTARAAEVLSGRESLTVQAAAMLLLDHVHTSMPRQKRP
ncbi:MAG: hypothetical protein ACLTGT_01190 [Oscillospiraceae bacterium]